MLLRKTGCSENHQTPKTFKTSLSGSTLLLLGTLLYMGSAPVQANCVYINPMDAGTLITSDMIKCVPEYDPEVVDVSEMVDNGNQNSMTVTSMEELVTQQNLTQNILVSTDVVTGAVITTAGTIISGNSNVVDFQDDTWTYKQLYEQGPAFTINTPTADGVTTFENFTINRFRNYAYLFKLEQGKLVLDNVNVVNSSYSVELVYNSNTDNPDNMIEIKNSSFYNLQYKNVIANGALVETKSNFVMENVRIKNFYQLATGGVIELFTYSDKYLIKDTEIDSTYNVMYSRGDSMNSSILYFANSSPKESLITVQDSSFTNNIAYRAGAISVNGYNTDGMLTLNLIADAKDVVFNGNQNALTKTELQPSDIALIGSSKLNIYTSADHAVEIHDGITAQGNVININPDTIDYQYNHADGTEIKLTNKVNEGTAKFWGTVDNADIHLYGGTLALYANNVDTTNATAVSTINHLATSALTIEGDSRLITVDATPITKEAKEIADEVALLQVMEKASLSTVYLGSKLTLNSNLSIQPTVNLETAQSDQYTVGGDVAGSGKLMVTGWIVKADKTENGAVTVDLAAAGQSNLKGYFGLADGAKVAYGPTYVWSVVHDDNDTTYTFVKGYVEPILEDEGAKDGIENDIKDKIQDLEDQQKDVESGSEEEKKINQEISELKNILEKVDQYSGSRMTDSPYNYNPEIYGEQVSALGVSVIQNAVSDSVFSEMRIGQLGRLLAGEKAERKEWWGKVSGADLDLKTKNFYKVQVDYALGMIGHQFTPIITDFGSIEFGAYVGAVTANEKFSISKVKQNGGLIGGSVLCEIGNAWVGAHANIGVMSNHLKGITDNKTTNPWFGLGASTGYNFSIPRFDMAFAPFLDLSYIAIKAKDYTTNLGAEVKNSSLHSFELSPGFSVDKKFGQGWGVHGHARYAIVSKHDGKTQAAYSNNSFESLPCITNKNYVEYGVGLLKHGNNWGFAMNVSRSDGGRSGWSGTARLSYRF